MTCHGNRADLLKATATLPPARARMVLQAVIARDEASSVNGHSSLEEAAAAFEKDMAPVRKAIVSALTAGDVEALRGLRAMLPHLLAEVSRSPELADLLAHQIGKSLVEGLTAKPGDTL